MAEPPSMDPQATTGGRRSVPSDGPELQRLLDAISSGAITDVDELEEHELELLEAYAHDGESMQALLDRLRGGEANDA